MGEICYLSSRVGTKLGKEFFKRAAKKATEKNPFNHVHLGEVIEETEFDYDYYDKPRHAGSIARACVEFRVGLPYEWTDEYKTFMHTFHKDTASDLQRAQRNHLIEVMKAAGRPKKLPESAKPGSSSKAEGAGKAPSSKAGASKAPAPAAGASKAPAPTAGASKAPAPAAGASKAPAPAPGAGKAPSSKSKSSDGSTGGGKSTAGGSGGVMPSAGAAGPVHAVGPIVKITKEHVIRLTPPKHVIAVKVSRGGERNYIHLVVEDVDFKEVMQKLETYDTLTYEDFLKDHYYDKEQESIPEVSKYFENTVGWKNFIRFEIPSVEIDTMDLPEDLKIYVVSRLMLRAYMEAGVNEYEKHEIGPMQPLPITSNLHQVCHDFGNMRGLANYFDKIEDIRQEQEAEKKRKANADAKKKFFENFDDIITADKLRARHDDYIRLKNEGVITQAEYYDRLDLQTTEVMQKAGVTKHNYSAVMLNNDEMTAMLTVFTELTPRFTVETINAYIWERDDKIKLCSQAADVKFNKKFENDYGESLKDFIEASAVPGIWPIFEKDYNAYLMQKELAEKLEKELNEKLDAMKKRLSADGGRQGSPEPSGVGSPRPGNKRGVVQLSSTVDDDEVFEPKTYNKGSKPAKPAIKSHSGSRAGSEEPPAKSRRPSVDESNVLSGKRERNAPKSFKARPGSRRGSPQPGQ